MTADRPRRRHQRRGYEAPRGEGKCPPHGPPAPQRRPLVPMCRILCPGPSRDPCLEFPSSRRSSTEGSSSLASLPANWAAISRAFSRSSPDRETVEAPPPPSPAENAALPRDDTETHPSRAPHQNDHRDTARLTTREEGERRALKMFCISVSDRDQSLDKSSVEKSRGVPPPSVEHHPSSRISLSPRPGILPGRRAIRRTADIVVFINLASKVVGGSRVRPRRA